MDLNNFKINLDNPHYGGDNITISSETFSQIKHEVAKLVAKNKLLKDQLKDFETRDIGYINQCGNDGCVKWQADSFGPPNSELAILRYCGGCAESYCENHMNDRVKGICNYCYERG